MSPVAAPAKRASSPSILSQIQDLKLSQQAWLAALGVAGMTLAIGLLGIHLPWSEQRQRLAARYNEEKERSELLLSIQRQRGQMQAMESDLLLSGGGATGLAGQVSLLGAQSGLRIESVIPLADAAAEPYVRSLVEIVAFGDLAHLLRFLQAVEQHRPLFWVEQLEVGEVPGTFQPQGGAFGFGQLSGPSAQEIPKEHKIRFVIGAVSRPKAAK